MATPRDIIASIYEIATVVYDNIQAAKGNREQCQRLADRVRMISNTLAQLVAELPADMLDTPYEPTPKPSVLDAMQDALGITSDPITMIIPWDRSYGYVSTRHRYRQASTSSGGLVFAEILLDLKAILENALALAKEYADKNWFIRVFRNGSHTEDFDAMFASLSEGIQQLSLALNVQIKQSMDVQAIKDTHRHHEVVSRLPGLQTSIQQLFTKLTKDIAIQQVDRDAARQDRKMILTQQKILAEQYVDLQYSVRALGQDEAAHHAALAWQLHGISQESTVKHDALARQLSGLDIDASRRHGQLGQHLQIISRDEAIHYGLLAQQLSSVQEEIIRVVSATRREQPKTPISSKLLVPFHELRIMKHIATGSFGKILHGRWSQQDVIIKVTEGPFTEEDKQAFIKEVNLLKGLRCEYVMGISAVCYEQGRLAYIMKYMQHGNLQYYLSQHTISAQQRYQIAIQVALGLKYLHDKGIIHRNLNSTNVLLDKDFNARIIDFGFAEQAHVSLTLGERAEDVRWQAPEVLASIYKPNKTSEVYSFGMILWSLITRRTPYAHLSDTEFMQQVQDSTLPPEAIPETTPAGYRELIEACWRKAPASRPTIGQAISILRLLEQEVHLIVTPIPHCQQASLFSVSSIPKLTPDNIYLLGCEAEKNKNIVQAKAFYKIAAAEDYPKAKTNLAFFYTAGTGCKTVKAEKAFNLFLEAAKQGHPRAMSNVAKCYRKGFGVLADAEQARYWDAQVQLANDSNVSSSSSHSSSSSRPASSVPVSPS